MAAPLSEPGRSEPIVETWRAALGFLGQRILGQAVLVNRLIVALLADGHLLVEGAPGLAKTTAIKTLASILEGSHQRIQFTPDLMPSDLTGSDIFRPAEQNFQFRPGPIFHNVVLADEINRAPPKVQSALLEAMGERQVTVGGRTWPLPDLFLVMATQNPIEQAGTYPLPEAQRDRFMLHVVLDYPDAAAERAILAHVRQRDAKAATDGAGAIGHPGILLTQAVIQEARRQVDRVHVSDPVAEYMVQLILATRRPELYDGGLVGHIAWGASPRATIALDRVARASAWLEGRNFITPSDVQALAPDVLRHRLIPTFEAEARGLRAQDLVQRLLRAVPVP